MLADFGTRPDGASNSLIVVAVVVLVCLVLAGSWAAGLFSPDKVGTKEL